MSLFELNRPRQPLEHTDDEEIKLILSSFFGHTVGNSIQAHLKLDGEQVTDKRA